MASDTREKLVEETRVRLMFAWFDLWIGAYWDRRQRRLYICPLPMLVVVVSFPPRGLP